MWYMCVFFHRLLDYRKPEVEALAELFGAFAEDNNGEIHSLEWKLPDNFHPDNPFHFVNIPSEDIARNIAKRSILVKGMYEIWGEGTSYDLLEEAVNAYPDDRKLPYLTSENSFKINIDSFGKTFSTQEQKELLQKLAFIPFKGADIDIRVVRDGRGPDRNVWSNFKQYGLQEPISLLRADNNLPPWRAGLKEMFDAIICDPPYGVRAGGRKSGGRKLLKGVVGPYTVPDDKRAGHIPSTAAYSLVECVHDLLDLAARMLVMGGRLVYFYPVLREEDSPDPTFPEHPCFKLVAVSEQILSFRYSRVLLTMVKVESYTEKIADAAKVMHLDFKANHLKWLDEGNLHSAVFAPAPTSYKQGEKGESNFSKESKPKYRGKYV